MAHARLSGQEIERHGQALYEQNIRARVEPGHNGKICMVDVESGDYEIGDTMLETSNRILARKPDAALWAMRVGSDVVYDMPSITAAKPAVSSEEWAAHVARVKAARGQFAWVRTSSDEFSQRKQDEIDQEEISLRPVTKRLGHTQTRGCSRPG